MCGRQVKCNRIIIIVVVVIVDDNFSLSYGETTEKEGEDAYCYRGEACLTKELIEDFEASWVVVLQVSLWMNKRVIVNEEQEIYFHEVD